MNTIDKVEAIKEQALYLKYYFTNGDVKILPRSIYELISLRDVFVEEVRPVVEAEKLKEEPSANILNLAENLKAVMNCQLDNLLNQCIAWQNAAIELYELNQKIEQTRSFELCKKRDEIMSYDVINKTLFPA